MACSSCSRRKSTSTSTRTYDVMGGYKHLSDNQIKARLEIFKKRHCSGCDDRYNCDFKMYNHCSKKTK